MRPLSWHRDLIFTLAARYKLPAVSNERVFVSAGGLISYGPYLVDQLRLAVSYVDCILKGEEPADLPARALTQYELAVGLKTAKTLGFKVPATVLVRADAMIECCSGIASTADVGKLHAELESIASLTVAIGPPVPDGRVVNSGRYQVSCCRSRSQCRGSAEVG